MRLLKFFIVVLVFASISFFVANCEKELIPVPEEEFYNTYPQYNWCDFYIDSIRIYQCPGPLPYNEFPDLIFCASSDSCSDCYNTSDQVLNNITAADLPLTFIPNNSLILDSIRSTERMHFSIREYDSWGGSCYSSGSNYIIASESIPISILLSSQLDQINYFSVINSFISLTVYFELK